VSSSPEPIAGGPSTAAARGPGRDRAGIDWGDGRKRSRGGNSRFFGGVKGESGKWRRFFFLWTWFKENPRRKFSGGCPSQFRFLARPGNETLLVRELSQLSRELEPFWSQLVRFDFG
jgi:hypothetical protein